MLLENHRNKEKSQMKYIFMLALTLNIYSPHSYASGWNSEAMVSVCRGGEANERWLLCNLFISGYLRGLNDMGFELTKVINYRIDDLSGNADTSELEITRNAIQSLNSSSKLLCYPENSSLQQLAKVFVKFADEHPELLHKQPNHVFGQAISKTFCP